jgi:hypothetical protein
MDDPTEPKVDDSETNNEITQEVPKIDITFPATTASQKSFTQKDFNFDDDDTPTVSTPTTANATEKKVELENSQEIQNNHNQNINSEINSGEGKNRENCELEFDFESKEPNTLDTSPSRNSNGDHHKNEEKHVVLEEDNVIKNNEELPGVNKKEHNEQIEEISNKIEGVDEEVNEPNHPDTTPVIEPVVRPNNDIEFDFDEPIKAEPKEEEKVESNTEPILKTEVPVKELEDFEFDNLEDKKIALDSNLTVTAPKTEAVVREENDLEFDDVVETKTADTEQPIKATTPQKEKTPDLIPKNNEAGDDIDYFAEPEVANPEKPIEEEKKETETPTIITVPELKPVVRDNDDFDFDNFDTGNTKIKTAQETAESEAVKANDDNNLQPNKQENVSTIDQVPNAPVTRENDDLVFDESKDNQIITENNKISETIPKTEVVVREDNDLEFDDFNDTKDADTGKTTTIEKPKQPLDSKSPETVIKNNDTPQDVDYFTQNEPTHQEKPISEDKSSEYQIPNIVNIPELQPVVRENEDFDFDDFETGHDKAKSDPQITEAEKANKTDNISNFDQSPKQLSENDEFEFDEPKDLEFTTKNTENTTTIPQTEVVMRENNDLEFDDFNQTQPVEPDQIQPEKLEEHKNTISSDVNTKSNEPGEDIDFFTETETSNAEKTLQKAAEVQDESQENQNIKAVNLPDLQPVVREDDDFDFDNFETGNDKEDTNKQTTEVDTANVNEANNLENNNEKSLQEFDDFEKQIEEIHPDLPENVPEEDKPKEAAVLEENKSDSGFGDFETANDNDIPTPEPQQPIVKETIKVEENIENDDDFEFAEFETGENNNQQATEPEKVNVKEADKLESNKDNSHHSDFEDFETGNDSKPTDQATKAPEEAKIKEADKIVDVDFENQIQVIKKLHLDIMSSLSIKVFDQSFVKFQENTIPIDKYASDLQKMRVFAKQGRDGLQQYKTAKKLSQNHNPTPAIQKSLNEIFKKDRNALEKDKEQLSQEVRANMHDFYKDLNSYWERCNSRKRLYGMFNAIVDDEKLEVLPEQNHNSGQNSNMVRNHHKH